MATKKKSNGLEELPRPWLRPANVDNGTAPQLDDSVAVKVALMAALGLRVAVANTRWEGTPGTATCTGVACMH